MNHPDLWWDIFSNSGKHQQKSWRAGEGSWAFLWEAEAEAVKPIYREPEPRKKKTKKS